MARRRTVVLASATLLGAAALTAAARAVRRWERSHDPTAGEPLCLPDGEEVAIATADGGTLYATVAGPPDGRTFVLAHCWTGDRRVWGPVARALVDAGHRVVLYDHRGHGASKAGSHGLSLTALAADLRTVLEHLDLRGVTLAGHSMGGMCAQTLAVEHPEVVAERVDAMVLVSTACQAVSAGKVVDRFAELALGHPRVEWALSRPALAPRLVRGAVGKRPALSHLQAAAETFVATAAEARTGFFTAIRKMDLSEALPAVDVPVTVVCGTHDRLLPPRYSKRIAELIPGAELVLLQDAGHMLPWEEPERLVDLLIAAKARTREAVGA